MQIAKDEKWMIQNNNNNNNIKSVSYKATLDDDRCYINNNKPQLNIY